MLYRPYKVDAYFFLFFLPWLFFSLSLWLIIFRRVTTTLFILKIWRPRKIKIPPDFHPTRMMYLLTFFLSSSRFLTQGLKKPICLADRNDRNARRVSVIENKSPRLIFLGGYLVNFKMSSILKNQIKNMCVWKIHFFPRLTTTSRRVSNENQFCHPRYSARYRRHRRISMNVFESFPIIDRFHFFPFGRRFSFLSLFSILASLLFQCLSVSRFYFFLRWALWNGRPFCCAVIIGVRHHTNPNTRQRLWCTGDALGTSHRRTIRPPVAESLKTLSWKKKRTEMGQFPGIFYRVLFNRGALTHPELGGGCRWMSFSISHLVFG